ncbi:MAG: DUF3368 domain-containing protein, partial [Cyanobacteria bacterium J06638_22]
AAGLARRPSLWDFIFWLIPKQQGLIPTLKPILDRLVEQAGFRVSQTLYMRALQEAGESTNLPEVEFVKSTIGQCFEVKRIFRSARVYQSRRKPCSVR